MEETDPHGRTHCMRAVMDSSVAILAGGTAGCPLATDRFFILSPPVWLCYNGYLGRIVNPDRSSTS